MTSRTREVVPEWLVERLARGELPPETAASVRARLEATDGLGRLAELEASDREILAAHPPAEVATAVRRRMRLAEARAARRGSRHLLAAPAAALAVAAGAVLFVAIPNVRRGTEAPLTARGVERVATRGLRPHLVVYRKTASGPDRLEAPVRARAGDVLQLAYVAGGRPYGVVLSVDARGTVTLHLPEAPGPAPRLDPRGETALPHAFALDDAPGFERFVFVTADVPFGSEVAVEVLRPGGGPLPAGVTASELVIEKESP